MKPRLTEKEIAELANTTIQEFVNSCNCKNKDDILLCLSYLLSMSLDAGETVKHGKVEILQWKNSKNKVASQDDFVPLTGGNIAQCISTGYRLYLDEEKIAKYEAKMQQLEVRNKYLSGLIQGYDSSIA